MTVTPFPQKILSEDIGLERDLLAAEVRFLESLQEYAKKNPIRASERLGEHSRACCRIVRAAILGAGA